MGSVNSIVDGFMGDHRRDNEVPLYRISEEIKNKHDSGLYKEPLYPRDPISNYGMCMDNKNVLWETAVREILPGEGSMDSVTENTIVMEGVSTLTKTITDNGGVGGGGGETWHS